MDRAMYNNHQQQFQQHHQQQQRMQILAAQRNHNHRNDATTANTAGGQRPATAVASKAPTSGVCAHPIMPVDLGIDLASVKAEIDNCKRRYHRDLWSVLCGKVLLADKSSGAGGGGDAGNWKKTDRDEESTGGGGAGVAKRGEHHDTARTDEEGSAEDEQAGNNGEEDETTDEGANENNRQQSLQQRQPPPQNRQQQQTRGGMRRGSMFRDDWNNWNNSADWRTAPAVGFSDRGAPTRQCQSVMQPPSARTQRSTFETSTAPAVRARREDEDGNSSGAVADFCSARATAAYDWVGENNDADEDFEEDADSADSTGSGPRRRFVPMFCGNWGTQQQQQRKQQSQQQQQLHQRRPQPIRRP